MSQPHVLILGAGFGGLELATSLSERLPGQVRVTLIDRSDGFSVGFRKLDVLFGRKSASEVKAFYRDLAHPAVQFRQETVTAIDPIARRVVTDGGDYDAAFLVVALGADVVADATPGLVEGGYEFYTMAGAEKLRPVLAALESGTVVIGILGMPYKCPPAPFEMAFELDAALRGRGVRSQVAIRVLSPAATPLPVSKEGSDFLLRLMAERGIEFAPGQLVTGLDPAGRAALVDGGPAVPCDLFVGVPVHRVPPAVAASGLAPSGWVAVDAANLATSFPGVYAVGDVTTVTMGGGSVPKAGAFADKGARAVADDIVHRITGSGSPGKFESLGACFVALGGGAVAKVQVDLRGQAPDVQFLGPDAVYELDKAEFEATRLSRWFSSDRPAE